MSTLSNGTQGNGPSGAPPRSVRRSFFKAARVAWFVLILVVMGTLSAAWIAGWRFEYVMTSSMQPTIPTKSLAVVKPVNPAEVTVGAVISYGADRTRPVLHRVVEIVRLPDGAQFFRTKGDANAVPDAARVATGDVLGRLVFHVPKMGHIVWALRPPVSLAVFIGVPLLAFGFGEILKRRSSAGKSPKGTGPWCKTCLGRCPQCGSELIDGAPGESYMPTRSSRSVIRQSEQGSVSGEPATPAPRRDVVANSRL